MSGNQKQAPSGAPQQQRYAQDDGWSVARCAASIMVSRYVSSVPMKPEGLCLLPPPPPPHHYRMLPPHGHRADGYHVTSPPTGYVPQQASNQQANQGQNIRGMAPTGPPNQSSTPPQNDLKQMQQQSGQLPMFVQQQVRAGQPSGGFFRTPTPNQGGPRISNHHRQTMASNAAAATPIYSQHMQIYPTPMAQPMTSYPMTMQYNAPRPPGNYYGQPFPVMHGQFLHGTFPTQQAQAQQFYYPNATALTMANRQGPPPPVAAAPPQNPAQATQQPMQMQPAMTQPTKRKNRSNAIPIINPLSGKEIFDEEESQPPSGESSARETPQPPSTTAMQQLISADFAARVAIVASEDKVQPAEPEPPAPVTVTYGAPITMQPPPVQPPHNAVHMVAVCPPKENDIHKVIESSVVQNSKLQASVKEFIPEITKHVPKESTTPVVSANTEGVEVTLPNKQSRDRESPSKIRRNQPHQHQPHHLHQQPHQQHQQPHQQQPHQQPHQQQPHQQQPHQQQLHQQQPHQQQTHQQQPHQQQPHQQQPHQQPQQQPHHQPHQQPHQQIHQTHQPHQHQPEPVPQQHREPPKEIIVPAGPPPAILKEVPRAQVSVSPVNQVAAHEPELKDPKPVVVNAKVKSMPPSEFTKGPPPVVVDHRPTPPHTNSVAAVPDDTIVNAKSKGGAQKAKESVASVAAQPPAPKAAMPVPGSQPAKPSSKANKLRELNMKGANKEGTDMDAFNSTPIAPVATTPPIENCNSEPVPPVVVAPKEELIEPEPEQIPTPTPPPQQPIAPVQAPVQPAAQVMAPPPQKAEVKPATLPKQKIDITSIVKEIPRPLKPQPAPAPATQEQMQSQQSTTDSNDETDRAACEKLVQVKNETNNIKTNSSENSDTQAIDKTVIRYKKDQWSPMNTDGKKSYDRDFLMNLQLNPKCKKKPDNLPDLEIILKDSNRARGADPRSFSSNRQSELLMPAFHKSLSQRGPLPKRNSQQGNKGGSKSGSKPNTIHVTLSLREDVKLRETENAWRPARQNASDATTKDEMKTADLYKKVRGVLNKLTPEKFEKLLNQVRSLSIDNEERLQGVIDLVFEKAVDEPNFSVAYANMCKELATMQVPANSKNKDDPEFVNFRKLLITRCQLEFEKNTQLENERLLKQKEVEACTDPEKIKELQMQLEDDERRMRVKSVGNIRFIGELFKQNMLTVRIMLRCMNILLENKDEDSLECLCKLLTTIGKDLESKNQNLQNYFTQMQDFVDKKRGRISSRVRFMLQDVIDLRNSKWVPRRQDLNPKTMDQIQKEADTEQLNIQVMNLNPMTPRKDDRLGGQGSSNTNSDHKRRSNQTDDSGWTIPTSRNRTPYTVESSKLMNKPPPMEEMTLGSKNLFGQWGRGSNIKTQTHAPITNTTNMYAALENINADAEKSRPSYDARMNKDPYVSKGHSMDRSGYKQNYEDGRGSRSGSQHRNQPHHQQPQPQKAPVVAPPPVAVVSATPQMNPEQLRLRMKNILDEYLNDCSSLTECEQDIRASIDPSKLSQFIEVSCHGMLERSQSKRHKTGKLYSHLIKCELLTIDDMCVSLTEVLSQAEDLIIDVPMLWNYLSEMILPLVTDDVITLDILCKCSEVLVAQGYAHKLFAQLLKQLVADKGPNYVADIWKVSGIRCADFMPADDVDAYIKDNKFDFLMGGAGTPVVIPSSLSWEQVHIKLLQLFKSNTHSDTVFDWINANVGERVKENQFVRKLVTAVVEVSVTSAHENRRLRYEILKTYYFALQRYIDNQENLELQCILAVQALVQKWDHPPGLLLSIFLKLWEDGILSNDCFLAWEKNNDPMEQEGKGVALKSLQSLFTALKENDYETLSSTSDDA